MDGSATLEAQTPEIYEYIIRHYGTPNECVTVNVRVCKGKRWTSINRHYCTGTGAVCMRTALFTDVGIYEACNNKVRYYRKSVMRRVYLGE